MPKNIILEGVSGYIESHTCKALRNFGYRPIIVDNLSTGWSEAVKLGPIEKVDLLDRTKLDRVFREY